MSQIVHGLINFPENLAEVLPTNYGTNLALLPKEQRDAIAEDFRRWRLCKEVFSKRFGCETKFQLDKADTEIASWVKSLEPIQYQTDMRRRLNEMRSKLKK